MSPAARPAVRNVVLAASLAGLTGALGSAAYLFAALWSWADPAAGAVAGLLAIIPALPWWPILAPGEGGAHWPLWVGYGLNTVFVALWTFLAARRNPA